jgi:5-methyltetrahydropteroyltriglutamate--homocysteine methyltransferase
MKRSSDRIRTTHAGRLPVSPGLENLPVRLYLGEVVDPAVIAEGIAHGIRKQVDLGIDCIGDGEFWKARDFIYYSRHLTGIERRPLKPGETGSTRTNTRERDEFAQSTRILIRPGRSSMCPASGRRRRNAMCTVARGPIKSKGTAALAQEIAAFKAALARAGRAIDETFFCVIAPGWLDHFIYNEYYKTDEEFIFALADALREEYLAIVDAGFILQIDDPGLVDWWDMLKPALSVEEYRDRFARLAHRRHQPTRSRAFRKIAWRYHLCWGSLARPHTHDLRLSTSLSLMLQVNAQCYFVRGRQTYATSTSGSSGNDVKLPDGKILLPGVVSHSTNLVEHPELVAERIMRFAARSAAKCHRRHRLGLGRPRACRDRLGEAPALWSRRAARLKAVVAIAPAFKSDLAPWTWPWWQRCRRLRLLGLAALDREFELRLPAQLVRLALRLGLLSRAPPWRSLSPPATLRFSASIRLTTFEAGATAFCLDTGAPACLRLSMSTTASS